MDVVADILRTLRLHGTVYFEADFGSPWGIKIPGGRFANFHLVVAGRCWVSLGEHESGEYLEAGDIVVFPNGSSHLLGHAKEGQWVPADRFLSGPQVCHDNRLRFGGSGPSTTLICGHFEYDAAAGHPLMTTLPNKIRLRPDQHDNQNGLPQPRN